MRSRYFAPMLSSTTSAPWPSVASRTHLDEVLFAVVDRHVGAQREAPRRLSSVPAVVNTRAPSWWAS